MDDNSGVGGFGQAIALDGVADVYLTCVASNTALTTVKLSPDGQKTWRSGYTGPAGGRNQGNAITLDSAGNVYVTGYSTTTNGGTEFVTIKYAELQNIQKKGDGSIQLQFFGTPGQTSAFYGGTNLSNWDTLGSSVAGTNGIVQFTDTNAPLFRYRFYRRYLLP